MKTDKQPDGCHVSDRDGIGAGSLDEAFVKELMMNTFLSMSSGACHLC